MYPSIMRLLILLQALSVAAVPWNGRRQDVLEDSATSISALETLPGLGLNTASSQDSAFVFPAMPSGVFLPETTAIVKPRQIPDKLTAATPTVPIHKSSVHTDLKPLNFPHLHSFPHIMRRNLNQSNGESTALPPLPSLPSLPSLSQLASLLPTPSLPNVFASPIDTIAPIPSIPTVTTHPVPRLGVQQVSPINTNKFYANFFLGDQFAGTWTHPYQVSWTKPTGGNSGMAISHVDSYQRALGPNSSVPNTVDYFINPIGLNSMILSAAELSESTALTTSNLSSFAASVTLSPTAGASPAIVFPLVQGMGFVTGIYNGVTPLIQSTIGFFNMTRAQSNPKVGITKYTFITQDQKKWLLYAHSPSGAELNLTLETGNSARAATGFNGVIQIAKDPGGAEAMYDAGCGTYPTDGSVSGSLIGQVGSYSISWKKAGLPSPLIMFALPHHVESFSPEMNSSLTNIQLQTTTKGMAIAVVRDESDSWDFVEPNTPVDLGFAPWTPANGTVDILSLTAINAILPIAQAEVAENMAAQVDCGSMYYSGKALAKFAAIVYTLNDLLHDPTTALTGLNALKAQFAQFVDNQQTFPLYYETAWGGMVSSASYTTGNSGDDFGNTYYNDHHFHYGYFIYTGAIIAHLDPLWLLENNSANKNYVNLLARDIANPSSLDPLFPISRMFDWYHGHSWAHGLYETYDGKDQESSSEDSMSAYALKMWGKVIGDSNMEARGNIQLAVTARSLQNYFLYSNTNTVEPADFIGNRVSGILFENKIDHTTYFGGNPEYIQGIHMLPLMPHSTLTRTQAFVAEEWATWFDNGRAELVVGGWKGVLFANLGIVEPVTAWSFFIDPGFTGDLLDGGASRTWYLAWIAGLGGCSS